MMPRQDQGVSDDRYSLIPRTLIFITRGDRVLLLKGAAGKRLWAGRFNGVGGHIERGEDPLSAARRELVEETGLHVLDLRLCGTITVDTGEDLGIGIYVFKGESDTGELRPSSEGSLEWVPKDSIEKLDLVEDLPILLPRLLQMSPLEPPFAAHYSYDEDDRLVIRFGH